MKNLKPFDLQAALAGKAVMLRNGSKTHVRHHETDLPTEIDEELLGRLEDVGSWISWTWCADGKSRSNGSKSPYDIIGMYSETRIINGFEVPAPEKKAPKHNTTYYLASPDMRHFHSCESWDGNTVDKLWLERGLVFLTAEDAIATAKAMLGIDPYGETES
jgi:hypothetical protein